jgi:hypothetical protein
MLKTSRVKKEPTKCACGRLRSAAIHVGYRSGERHFKYFRCECGLEWTVIEAVVDRHDPVSSDEVLEVRKQLEGFEGTIAELLGG